MLKKIRFVQRVIFGLILSLMATNGYGQSPALSMVSTKPVLPTQQVQRYVLVDLLTNLEKQHGIIFDYNPRLLRNNVVALDQKDLQNKNLEDILVEVLSPFSLKFKKYNAHSYLIYSKKSKESPSFIKGGGRTDG